jgi:hypothetical protein
MDYYKENTMPIDADEPFINDAITADDAGFSSDIGDQPLLEEEGSEESFEEASEASEGEGVQAESSEELKEEIQDAIEEGATEEEVKDMIREFTIKVNGKEKNVTLDLNDEADVIRRLQLGEASQVAMQEKRELEKSYEEEVRNLLENPEKYLREIGLDPLELGEKWVRNEVEERKKSPEIRETERIKRELTEAREELRLRSEEADSARRQQLESQESIKIENEIDAALDAHPKLPRSQKTITRIADAWLFAIEHAEELGIDPNEITVEDVIPTVESEIRNELRDFMTQLPEDMMEEYIGSKNLERMRNKRLNSMKPNNVSNVKATGESNKKVEESKPKKRVKSKDYFRNL